VIWSLLLQALILQSQANRAAAQASLQRALTLAEPQGYVRMVVNHGAPIAALLREAYTRGIAPAYIEQLLHTLPRTEQPGLRTEYNSPQASVLSRQSSVLVEALSARERDVLRLLANGMDNAQIARTLAVAISTVKAHINHTFGKLGVHSRLEAVLRAQELNLIVEDAPKSPTSPAFPPT